jgi:LPXTG-motif cell wall-anchored protein
MSPRVGARRRLNVVCGLAVLVAGMLGGGFTLLEPAAQASVNLSCPQGTTEYKVASDPLAGLSNGQSAPFTVNGVTFTFTKVAGPAPFVDDTFDFTSSVAVSTVFVKGGEDTNVYDYAPPATSGSALHPPLNGGDQAPDISHVTFCIATPGTTTTSTVPASSTSTSTSTTATSTSTSTTVPETTTSTTVPDTTTSTTVPETTTSTTIGEQGSTTTTTVPEETTTSTSTTPTTVHSETTIVTTTTRPESTTTVREQGSTIPTTSTTDPVIAPGSLPRTGSGSAVAAMFGILLVAAGVLFVAGRRKPWVRS